MKRKSWLLLAALLALALLAAAALLARPVGLAVRMSLAVETPAEVGAFFGYAWPGQAAPLTRQAWRWVTAPFWRMSAQVVVDAGAVVIERSEYGSAWLPARAGSRTAGVWVQVASVTRDGAVELRLGSHQVRLPVGGTVDAALVPAAGGGWAIEPGPDWPRRIESLLAGGEAAGRLSITNLGRSAAGRSIQS